MKAKVSIALALLDVAAAVLGTVGSAVTLPLAALLGAGGVW
ncbi:hypothetical protein [Streptomyces hoynatensis]|nr:hypothetical protein [Streptomyces hoynatensis]